MTEEEANNNPKMMVVMLLSGFYRELMEGKDYETLNYKYADLIDDIYDK